MKKWIGIIIAVAVVAAFAQAWYLEDVDTTGNVGQYSSLVIDSKNMPHIAYFYADSGYLKYATWNGSIWASEFADKNSGLGGVGINSSLAIGSISGLPQIAYYDALNGHLKWATKNSTGDWVVGIPHPGPDNVGIGCDIALGVQNNQDIAHISYYDATAGMLLYARPLGSQWSRDTVDTGGVGVYTSIALDPAGNPHIAYYDTTYGNLKYAHLVSGAWVVTEVDTTGDVGLWPDIAIDTANGNVPYISYYDRTHTYFKYARWTGSAWAVDVIDNTPGVGQFGSQELGSTYVSYYDASNGNLKYGYSQDYLGWHTETVDTTADCGQYTSIALTYKKALTYPHISYYDVTNGNLKYASRIIKDVLPTVIVSPPKNVNPDSSYIPAVTVLNQGNTVAACSVTCAITYSGLDVYHGVSNVGPLNVDEEAQVSFAPWKVLSYDNAWYHVVFKTWLPDDSVPANDMITDSVHATQAAIEEKIVPVKLDLSISGSKVVLSLPKDIDGQIVLYDVTGSRKLSLDQGKLEAGMHVYALDKRDLPSGVYFVKFTAGQTNLTRKAILVN